MAEFETFAFSPKPGAGEVSFFRENGFLYVSGFYDYETEIREIHRNIFDLIGLIADQHGIPLGPRTFSAENFDSGLPYLVKHHRSLVGVLYDAVKKLPSYVRLACCGKHDIYARELLGSSFVGFANRGYGIRMDNPGEDHYATQLHQDYVSQLCSQRAAVIWSPLRDTTSDMGPVVLYPGSHRDGVFPIAKVEAGSRGLVIADEQELIRRYPAVAPTVRVGDCVFVDFLTLHESGRNRTDRTRWAMISRYFDFLDPSGRSIHWKGGLQEGNSFEKIHPEFCRMPSDPTKSQGGKP